MSFKGKLDLILIIITIIGIPLILLDGLSIINQFTIFILVIMSIALSFRLQMSYPNHIPLYNTAHTPSLWDWLGAGWVGFIAVLLGLTIPLLIISGGHSIIEIVATCIAFCANMRLTIPDWIVAIKSTKTILKNRSKNKKI